MRKFALIPAIMMLFACAGNAPSQSLSSAAGSSESSSTAARPSSEPSLSEPSAAPSSVSSETVPFSDSSSSVESSSDSSSSTHSHTYEEGYEFDEEHHWREATCGHEGRDDYGPHEFSISYDVEDSAIVVIHTCVVCGYGYKESTYDEHQFDTAAFKSDSSGDVYLSSLGERRNDTVINYPREINGKPLVSIFLRDSDTTSPRPDHGVVFVPGTVRMIRFLLAYTVNLDIFFEVTLQQYLTLNLLSFYFCPGEFNLHLLDGEGHYYLVRDLVLPEGLERFKGESCFARSTVETIVCNSDLESFAIMECYRLREIRFNEGLKTLRGLAGLSGLRHITYPSTLTSPAGLYLRHLYTVTIAEGADIGFSLPSLDGCPRLVGVFDHRDKRGRAPSEYPSTVIFTEDNESEFRLIEDGGFVYVPHGGAYRLIDYVGDEFEASLPKAVNDGGRVADSYEALDVFLHIDPALNEAFSEETLRALAAERHERFFTKLTVPASVTAIIKTSMGAHPKFSTEVYFEMGRGDAFALLGGDPGSYFSESERERVYCLDGGSYVPLFPAEE